MTRVFSEVFRAINHKPLATEKIYPMRYTFSINLLPCTFDKIFRVFETQTLFYAAFEHLT